MELDLIIYIQQNMSKEEQILLFLLTIFICSVLMIIDSINTSDKEEKKRYSK